MKKASRCSNVSRPQSENFKLKKRSKCLRKAQRGVVAGAACTQHLRQGDSRRLWHCTHAFGFERGVADGAGYLHNTAHAPVADKATRLHTAGQWLRQRDANACWCAAEARCRTFSMRCFSLSTTAL
jgi:hypothetical protein